MPSDRALLERQMADVEVRSFTLDEFHRRRHQKQRNRRIATAVMGLAVAAGVAGGIVNVLAEDDEMVDSDVLGPLPSPVAGEWVSTDSDGSSQTMEILRTDGDEHQVVVRDDAATVCSGAPSTMTGTGLLTSVTELILPQPVLVCDDGTTPSIPDGPPLEEELANLTFFHDPETDELQDSLGVVWRRPGAPSDGATDGATVNGDPVLASPSPFEGSWVASGVGEISPESMEITRLADGDVHEIVVHNDSAAQCSGGASTLNGTGRRETDSSWSPGLVQLATLVALTCDDGTTAVPASPEEEGMLEGFPLTLVHDPVTDELVGSLGVLWWREGTEKKQGDPMATVERVVDAVSARDTDAFIDLFAPDGRFDPQGVFVDSRTIGDPQPISETDLVRAWMAIQDAWGFEADMGTCTSEPSDALTYGKAGDLWVECEVAVRWPKLSLEVTDRWRFELRGARLLYWEPARLDLDPSERDLPLGYPGLEAWEAWVEANHPEDAARWLHPREDATADWVIDGRRFWPAGLVPYDPAFAAEIEASIDEYLDAR